MEGTAGSRQAEFRAWYMKEFAAPAVLGAAAMELFDRAAAILPAGRLLRRALFEDASGLPRPLLPCMQEIAAVAETEGRQAAREAQEEAVPAGIPMAEEAAHDADADAERRIAEAVAAIVLKELGDGLARAAAEAAGKAAEDAVARFVAGIAAAARKRSG